MTRPARFQRDNPAKPADETRLGLTLELTPNGRLRVVSTAEPGADVPVEVSLRIRAAFDQASGHGLFHLGCVEASTALPPVLGFWRDLGVLFMTSLCALEDPDALLAGSSSLSVPTESLERLLDQAPPITGGEYLSLQHLTELWKEIESAYLSEIATAGCSVEKFLAGRSPFWKLVGRVHFHLAEQKGDAAYPFAFLATYTTRVRSGSEVQHRPLGKALEEFSGARNKNALLKLLKPLERASQRASFLKQMVDSGDIFHPLRWTPKEALLFLHNVSAFESSGVVVRIPDWWRSRHARHPQVEVSLGETPAPAIGLDGLLDFHVHVALDGEHLTQVELRQVLDGSQGLRLIRGQWVEVDAEKLEQVLGYWQNAKDALKTGVRFGDAMRLLSGANLPRLGNVGATVTEEDIAQWSKAKPGGWLSKTLQQLDCPKAEQLDFGGQLEGTLRPYQRIGVSWLLRLCQLRLGGCLADDMGLGKTIQVIALLVLHNSELNGKAKRSKAKRTKRRKKGGTTLLIVPTSLISNWKSEIERFAPDLEVLIAHPSAAPAKELRELTTDQVSSVPLVITSYGYVGRLSWTKVFDWDLVILDEAQAIKNPSAKQTRTVKALNSNNRLVLTGTPVENRLSDLWSIFDFINPGLLGSAKNFKTFAKGLDPRKEHCYAPLRKLIRPYILRRLKTDRSVISDLPDKTEVIAYCSLSKLQAALYEESVAALKDHIDRVDGIQRRGVVLSYLNRFKQICNHPSQWLCDGEFHPEHSGKFARLGELCETLASRQEKVLVFTQYRELTGPLAEYLARAFGRGGLVLHGQTPVKKRADLVEQFQQNSDVPFFVLSIKAGGTGLNLTAASQVIHFDRWWNPAVENQATDRAFRIGQKKNVLVHKFVCRGTIEERIDAVLQEKQSMSDNLLEGGAGKLLTDLDNDELMKWVSLDLERAKGQV